MKRRLMLSSRLVVNEFWISRDVRIEHRCNKFLQHIHKIIRKRIYYFVNVYYLNKHHMK